MNRMLAIAFAWFNALLAFVFIGGGALLGYVGVGEDLANVPLIGPLLERAPRIPLQDNEITRIGMSVVGAFAGFVVASMICGVFALLVSIEKSLRTISARY
jgi:hypothetical protein